MQTNVLEYLEQTVTRVPEKLAFSDGTQNLTFGEVYRNARAIGTKLLRDGLGSEPVVVFMEKSPAEVNAFFGVLYAGCYYVCLDVEMPAFRIEMILSQLTPRAVICDAVTEPMLAQYGYNGKRYLFEECIAEEIDEAALMAASS